MKRIGAGFFAGVLLLCFLLSQSAVSADAAETENTLGGIHIQKSNALGKGLPGACYRIAREATPRELRDSSVAKRLLRVGKKLLTVVYPDFWDNREMAGEKSTEAVTDSHGMAAVYGLPYGTYYLVETAPPEGYDRMEAPIRVSIHKYSHLTAEDKVFDDAEAVIDNTVHIITIRYALPDTGNPVLPQIAVSVIGLTVSSVVLLWLLRFRIRYV